MQSSKVLRQTLLLTLSELVHSACRPAPAGRKPLRRNGPGGPACSGLDDPFVTDQVTVDSAYCRGHSLLLRLHMPALCCP